tara:strand:+ start:1926 stop:3635 length:1710 start_codon:yes stop_codon:yes gene_type:complete
MAWELVLENVGGQNWWLLRPVTESSEECETTSLFSIDNVEVSPNTVVVNSLEASMQLFEISGVHDALVPVSINELAQGLSYANLSGPAAVGHSEINLNTSSSIIFTDYVNNTTDLTISFWVYPTSTASNDCFLFSSRVQGGNDCWSILRDGANWKVIWDQNNTQSATMSSVDIDQWQHIAVSWHLDGSDSGYVKFYKNGILEGEQVGVSDGPSGEWTIGGRSNDGTSIYGNRFEGYLSSISFHESVLTVYEILDMARADHDQDLSSNFENYTSSASLALAVLGGTGVHMLVEDYPDTYIEADSSDIQSLINYSLEVTTNTTGGTPNIATGNISYINKPPAPVPIYTTIPLDELTDFTGITNLTWGTAASQYGTDGLYKNGGDVGWGPPTGTPAGFARTIKEMVDGVDAYVEFKLSAVQGHMHMSLCYKTDFDGTTYGSGATGDARSFSRWGYYHWGRASEGDSTIAAFRVIGSGNADGEVLNGVAHTNPPHNIADRTIRLQVISNVVTLRYSDDDFVSDNNVVHTFAESVDIGTNGNLVVGFGFYDQHSATFEEYDAANSYFKLHGNLI